jgi:hypothetical protein
VVAAVECAIAIQTLMAERNAWPLLVGVPSKRGGVSRISCEKRSDAANVKVARGQTEGANYESLFARKPQISLAFDPQESNGRDVLRIDPPIG